MKKIKLNSITKIILLSGGLMVSQLSFADTNKISANKIENKSQVSNIKSNYVTSVDFLYEDKNNGIVELKINKNDSYKIKLIEKDSFTVIEIKNAFLPEHLSRKIVVDEFDTTINYIDSYYKDESTFIKLAFKEESTVKISDNGDVIKFNVTKKDPDVFSSKSKYMGDPISVEFQDISIREALRVLARYTEFNLVTTDTVSGNITVSLKDVPFDHALEVLLQSKGLGKKITDNIIYIAPVDELLKIEEEKLTARNKIDNLAALKSKFFQIKYAKASEIEKVVEALITERGKIIIDSRTNNLIVKDIESNLLTIESTISKLDIPIRQVLIEARIVIARKQTSQELGVKWGGASFDGKNYIGSNFDTAIEHFTADEFIPAGKTAISNVPAVDLGVSNAAGSLAFGIATDTGLLDMELSALESNGDAEVIARPKLLTADKKTAIIKSGSQIPYQQSSGGGAGATTIAFKDAVMLLEVTPQITPDDRIIMDLKIHQDSVGELTIGGPSIDTTQIETQVLVNNGETIVLGGIFQSEILDDVTKIPLLGDLPAIGKLFRNTIKKEKKTELLIFITPKLIESSTINY
jgi:type IV pilus assembly protein PilQ